MWVGEREITRVYLKCLSIELGNGVPGIILFSGAKSIGRHRLCLCEVATKYNATSQEQKGRVGFSIYVDCIATLAVALIAEVK